MEDVQVIADVQVLTRSLGQLPEPVVKPVFIVVSGLPGTGKSHLCGRLAERLHFVVLESDVMRKVLFPAPSYSALESARLFRAIHLMMEQLLARGISLILDATNLSENYRERLYRIAERLDVRLILVQVEAPPELVQARLQARRESGESRSDADWEVYQRMRTTAEKIQRNHFVVDTSKDIGPILDKIVHEAKRWK